jgi:hypothetical protein
MDYKKYLDKHLVNQVKEQIEENDENTFALVLINEQHSDYESVFDDLEMNHNFFTIPWGEEGEYSIRFLSGYNLDVSVNNLKAILKDVYIDSCVIPLSIIS